MIISLDTESTGLDWAHGARPFLVTTCDDSGNTRFWEWDVDPLTRQPQIPDEEWGDLAEIAELIDAADIIYLHNSKFDAHMLASVGIELPWDKVRDTFVAAHLLATNHLRNLTWCCIEYLDTDIEHFEIAVREVVRACRALVKKEHKDWRIADEGLEDMPSVKASSKRDEDKPWKNDMWLPRAYIKAHGGDKLHWAQVDRKFGQGWADSCVRYANADSENTLLLGLETDRLLKERGLWAIYQHRLNLPRVAYEMERATITLRGDYTDRVTAEYEEHVAEAAAAMHEIADDHGHCLELASGASINDNMRDFFYGAISQTCLYCGFSRRVKHWAGQIALETDVCPKCAGRKRKPMHRKMETTRYPNLCMSPIRMEKGSGKKAVEASLDKDAMAIYISTLEGDALDFVELLLDKRDYDTALTYLAAYRRFWIPVPEHPGYYRLSASLNPCGTDHLRWACNSPNLQNVSDKDDTGLRGCFGPLPGREWWRMDFKNIEKRVPAYECGEPALIEIFEKPDSPPFWGSDHNLICSLLWPDEYWPTAEERDGFKKAHPRKYKKAKNTNFAKQYGAGHRKVAMTSGVQGAFDLIDRGMPLLAKLQGHYLAMAESTGFVETLPDRTVDPKRGYPILASQTEDGRVLSTTPFNYHVSGTACWVKNMALVRCSSKLAKWRSEGFDAHIILEVHDEILFDMPRGETIEDNLPRARILQRLLEQGGEDLIPAIPSPVSVSYHTESWESGVTV